MAGLLLFAIILLSLPFMEKEGLRGALVFGATLFSAVLLAITEVFSLLSTLTPLALILFWCTFDALLACYCVRKGLFDEIKKSLVEYKHKFKLPFVGGFVLFALAVTLFIAIKAPPNNYDSMTYHMTRVAHWMQNQTLEHFPTHNTRQLFMSPGAEYAILHLQLLSFGSDRFANLVQWGAFLGAMVVASLLVARLGGGEKSQWFGALLVATTPMAILQASSTQTDLACSCWVLVFAWLVLRIVDRTASVPLHYWGISGLALALAVATKGTAYVFCAPFVVGLGVVSLSTRSFWPTVRGLMLVGVLAFVLNLPHFSRNLATFSHPLGDALHLRLLQNQERSPGILISNLLRNFSLHLQTPFEEVNEVVEQAVIALHGPLNVDPSVPATTWGGRYYLAETIFHEDHAGNLLLFGLIVLSGLLLARIRPVDGFWFYLGCAVAGIVLFSVILKWQIWGARLQLPFFLLSVPICSVVLVEAAQLPRRVLIIIAVAAMSSSLLWLFYNTSRPILKNRYNVAKNILDTTRIIQYFNNNRGPEVPYYYAVVKLKALGCGNVGLMTNLDSYEYPLFSLQREIDSRTDISYYHLFVTNDSARARERAPELCAILAIDQAPDWQPRGAYGGWRSVFQREHAQIFVPPSR